VFIDDNGRLVMQPILFHEMSVSWTGIAVQHILMPFMTPQSLAANTTDYWRAAGQIVVQPQSAAQPSVLTTFLPEMLRWKPGASAVFLETVITVLNKVKGRCAGSAGAPAYFTLF
jgi:hypothetical protein